MLKKLLAAVGMTLAAGAPPAAAEFYKPYAESHVNFLYNLLFCDDLNLFRNQEPLAKRPLHDLLRRSIRPRGAVCLVREVSVPELLT